MNRGWETVAPERRVLAVARTVTSLNRLLDVLVVFGDDPRIGVEFVVSSGSRFGAEVPAVLQRLGARIIPWHDAVATRYDLILSASDHDDLHELQGPVVLLPHGAGFQKYSPYSDHERAGLTGRALWHGNRRVPALIVVSHSNQRTLVPEFMDRTLVAGDPVMDGLVELVRRRGKIRRQLGVEPHQQLVTITSTWGAASLLGRWPTLPPQLLAELPMEEFRIAAVLHPNIWAAHGDWQVRQWLRTALASGLILIPPTGPWQSVLAAADCVVGDHGSLVTYASGLGVPLVLGAFGSDEVPRDTPMWQLGETLPRLDRHTPLADQIRAAIIGADPDVLRGLAAEVFERTGESLEVLQQGFYRLLSLSPTHSPRSATPPVWDSHTPAVRAFHLDVSDDGTTLHIQRYPAALGEFGRPNGGRRLIAYDDADEAVLQRAAGIIASVPVGTSWARATLDRFPGCRLAVVPVDSRSATMMLQERGTERTAYAATYRGIDTVAAAAAWLHLRARGASTTTIATTAAARGADGWLQVRPD